MNPLNCRKPKEAQMRLSPQRLLAGLLIAAMAFITACSSDSPTAPNPGAGGGGNGGLNLVLTTSNASPKAGDCVLVTGFATINGVPVPNGTSIVFTLQSGIGAFFGENGTQSISIVSQGGVASTLVCSPNTGTVTVHATVTLNGRQAERNLTITFTSTGQVLCPLISQCAFPSSGSVTGGQTVVITGCGFGTDPAQVRVFFRHNGVSHVAPISSVTDTQITVTTPAFPEIDPASATPVDVVVILGAGTTLTSPNCFTYTGTSLVPFVSAILPSSGTKLGGTRVTILGNNFTAPVQVFFQGAGAPGDGFQAQVTSVTFNQIIALTPPVLQTGAYAVVVKNAACQTQGGGLCTSNADVSYTYTVPLVATAAFPDRGDLHTPITIEGQGFIAPVLVTVGGHQVQVVSVTGTQIIVLPSATGNDCGFSGAIQITNLSTGETASLPGYIFANLSIPTITTIQPPDIPCTGTTTVVINGTGFWPTGQPSLVSIIGVIGGTVTLVDGSQNANGDQQVFAVLVTPTNACVKEVDFGIENNGTHCSTPTKVTVTCLNAVALSVTATGIPGIPSPGPPEVHPVNFSAVATGGTAPYSYSWTFGATDNPQPPTSATAAQTVNYNCGASGPTICAIPPDDATVTVTDACGKAVTATITGINPP